jgi:hypothetical protein
MGVEVLFQCDGCFKGTRGTGRLMREFVSVSGRSYGIGSVRPANTIEDVAPEGWIAYDPYTYCTYCPSCWDEIQAAPGVAKKEE